MDVFSQKWGNPLKQKFRVFYFVCIVLCLLVAFSSLTVFAESSLDWVKIFGYEKDDEAYSVAEADSGYVVCGITNSVGFGQYDAWLIKHDSNGLVEWNKTYGGLFDDNAHSVVATSDRGYALAGSSDPLGSDNSDFWLVKVDSLGNLQWNQTYDYQNYDSCRSLISTSDGGYALLGYTAPSDSTRPYGFGVSDVWIVKVDSMGNHQWNQTYGGDGVDSVSAIIQTSDGGYALGCSTTSFNAQKTDFWLVKIDSIGNIEWSQTYGDAGDEFANSLVVTSDGGYALAGSSGSYSAEKIEVDIWLVKVDPNGNLEWNQTFGSSLADYCDSMVISNQEGYALACVSQPPNEGDGVFWLLETDTNGNLVSNQTFGVSVHHSHTSLIKTKNGNYLFGGSTRDDMGLRDFWVAKIGEVNQNWTELFGPVLLVVIIVTFSMVLIYKKI